MLFMDSLIYAYMHICIDGVKIYEYGVEFGKYGVEFGEYGVKIREYGVEIRRIWRQNL